jgi:hypothetical protein
MTKAQLQTLDTEQLYALANAFGKAFVRAYEEKDLIVGQIVQDALEIVQDIIFERQIDDLNKLQQVN